MEKCFIGGKEVTEQEMWNAFIEELKANPALDRWWMNENGTLKCFGEAYSDYNQQSFHCAHLLDSGDCNEQVKRECLKVSNQQADKLRFHARGLWSVVMKCQSVNRTVNYE